MSALSLDFVSELLDGDLLMLKQLQDMIRNDKNFNFKLLLHLMSTRTHSHVHSRVIQVLSESFPVYDQVQKNCLLDHLDAKNSSAEFVGPICEPVDPSPTEYEVLFEDVINSIYDSELNLFIEKLIHNKTLISEKLFEKIVFHLIKVSDQEANELFGIYISNNLEIFINFSQFTLFFEYLENFVVPTGSATNEEQDYEKCHIEHCME